ncbi:MAG: 23S rRNA (uracil(1939)-C(5))-methyltransferase RlmD [Calditrichia bacterium]
MKRGQVLELDIEKLAFGGKGIARVENRVVFVEGTVPGDRVKAKIRRIKSSYIEARLHELIKPSHLRTQAKCSHFGYCGGCKWQYLDYEQQLHFKKEHVRESLVHIGKIDIPAVNDTLPSPLLFGYRNKMEFSFTNSRWLTLVELNNPDIKKDFGLGLHVPGKFDQIMNIDTCWLQDETMNRILNLSQQYFKKSQFPIYDLKTHQGLLRFLVIRKSFYEKNYQVNVVTSEKAVEELTEYSEYLTREVPEIVSVVNTVNSRPAQIALGEAEYTITGRDFLLEKIDPFIFRLSASSFFQTNPLQAERLYQVVKDFVGSGHNLLWDLYCGTGTIAMILSEQAKRIVGFELVESAVKDAAENCREHEIGNCSFIGGDLRQSILGQTETPDVVVCDPPRSGMHEDVVKAILKSNPASIVYVSCNPTTQARDIQLLAENYRVSAVQPVDMFPHTYHIESVVKLERKQ